MLILFYDTLWKAPLILREALPEGFEITTDRTRYAEADAVVFHLPQWRWQPTFLFPRKRAGQLWVGWSMESAENYPRLNDPQFMRRFDLTMMYRRDADVGTSYCGFDDSPDEVVRKMREPPGPKRRTPVAMFISSRVDRSGRRDYARELMRYLPIDSYGKFLNTTRLEKDGGRRDKTERLREYKFTLAFENARDRDYVTEKFFDPLVAGSVPIYLGAPNVDDFAPGEQCYLNVADYPNPKALAAEILRLDGDEAQYQEYFRWKNQPFRPAFEALLESQRMDVNIRLCYAVSARLADAKCAR